MSEHDALIESELRAVDEALATGTARGETALERELGELALALAAEAVEPDPDFSAELGERVRAGFPRTPRASRIPRPRLPSLPKLRRPPMIALAGAASVLAALAVAVSLQGRGENEDMPGTTGGAADAPSLAAPREGELERGPKSGSQDGAGSSSALPADEVGPVPPTPPGGGGAAGGFAPGERERRIERSAMLTLAAPSDGLDRVADAIVTVTDRYEGFVLRSSVSTGDEGTTGGDFELRIPADRLQAALRDLSKLGDVRARSQSGQDVTRDFVSAADRLEAARAERRSLLRRLENADSDTEAEAIRRRLDLTAAEINGLRGQLRDLRLRTDFATVSVILEERDGDEGSDGSGSNGGLREALDDALESLSGSVEILVRALGVAIPLSLLAALLWLGGRSLRRRRREAALS